MLGACVGLDLDSITATAVLTELRNACLYLHYDGVRYCFKKDPNVTKLIEDAESEVARHPDEIRTRIRDLLDQRLAGQRAAIVWPVRTQDLPDQEPTFLVGYLPLEFATEGRAEQDRQAKELFSRYGDRPRLYRNGLALAVPERRQIEALRRAARYLLAVERVDSTRVQHRLTREQQDQLRERRRTEEAAAEAALRALYAAVWLPCVENGVIEIEPVEVGGRPLQATGVHERIMELLTNVGTPRLHGSVTPRKIVERLRLGESLSPGEAPRLGIRLSEVRDAFFAFIEPPRLDSAAAIRKAVARGVAESTFAYTSGYVPETLVNGHYQLPRNRMAFARTLAEDEIDFESGFLIMPTALPEPEQAAPERPVSEVREVPDELIPVVPSGEATTTTSSAGAGQGHHTVHFGFQATREQVFKAFPAIANLADRADGGKVTIQVEATSQAGFDPAWLRNAVDEPLDEADVER